MTNVLENCNASALSRPSCPTRTASNTASVSLTGVLHFTQRTKLHSAFTTDQLVFRYDYIENDNLQWVKDRHHHISWDTT